jgi:hypothetical protein
MRTNDSLGVAATALVYLLLFPPGHPPQLSAPRTAWTGDGVRYPSADDCRKALTKSVVDAVTQKRGHDEIERAKNGICVRAD